MQVVKNAARKSTVLRKKYFPTIHVWSATMPTIFSKRQQLSKTKGQHDNLYEIGISNPFL